MDDERRDPKDTMEIVEGIDTEYKNVNEEDNSIYSKDSHNNIRKKSKRKRILSYLIVALIASLIGGLISSFIVMNYLHEGNLPDSEQGNQPYVTGNDANNDNPNAVSVAAQNAMSSVVGITAVEVQKFGPLQQEVDGVGSGVIVNSNGYILTNAHVVANGNAKELKVLFENGDEKSGKVLWHDAVLDLAMVKVDANNLPVATLGDSDKLEVGETAIAIGNPLGLDFQKTVTSGIISGLHRSINADGNVIEDLIQTDASINPGNSGGPLVNSRGEVIGINTAKIKSGEGLGFAIPINTVKPIIKQVIEKGDYKTVFMGITGVEVELYERQLGIDLAADKGVVIIETAQDSPASNANLKNGDVITKIDDQDIENMNQLKKSLYKYKKGDKAKLTIIRNGNEEKVEIEFNKLK
ncbi:trypsin-like peptidase domain-containing protein [Schnuerera sp. xch1]|uniref:serine protease HtrA n=1 Tax=Schnuerera sp. xch1 TaxID=2874283 RepID=UPI001CBF615B|nr:trypsin-like peptidase domain-containing protein [Schnuerera sp. xch1]MBZ2174695.1 trypsin-like peptidase domain-containing protein [Schnuerera sp. xch1]